MTMNIFKKSGIAVLALLFMAPAFTSCEEDSTVSVTYVVVADAYSPSDNVSKSMAEAIVVYQKGKGMLEKSFKESMDGKELTEEVRTQLDKKAATRAMEKLQSCDFAKIVRDAGISVPVDQKTLTIYYIIKYAEVSGGDAGHQMILEIEPSALK